jgi:hypothetical protein
MSLYSGSLLVLTLPPGRYHGGHASPVIELHLYTMAFADSLADRDRTS